MVSKNTKSLFKSDFVVKNWVYRYYTEWPRIIRNSDTLECEWKRYFQVVVLEYQIKSYYI